MSLGNRGYGGVLRNALTGKHLQSPLSELP